MLNIMNKIILVALFIGIIFIIGCDKTELNKEHPCYQACIALDYSYGYCISAYNFESNSTCIEKGGHFIGLCEEDEIYCEPENDSSFCINYDSFEFGCCCFK